MFISSGTPAVFKKCSPIMLLTSFGRQVVHHSKASSRYQSRQQQAFKKVFTTRAHLVFFFFIYLQDRIYQIKKVERPTSIVGTLLPLITNNPLFICFISHGVLIVSSSSTTSFISPFTNNK